MMSDEKLTTGSTPVFAMNLLKVTVTVKLSALSAPVAVTKADLPTLRFMTSSTAPLSVDKHVEFERTYGIPIVTSAVDFLGAFALVLAVTAVGLG